MRLFVAIDLPDSVASALAEVGEASDPTGEGARWTPVNAIHITLKFLGEVPDERAESIAAKLRSIRFEPVEIRVRGIGFFPNRHSPRVLWAGIDSPELQTLHRKVDDLMADVGFQPDSRAFEAHVTLARARRKGTMSNVLIRRATSFAGKTFGQFTARHLYLYRSHLARSGAVHERIGEVELART